MWPVCGWLPWPMISSTSRRTSSRGFQRLGGYAFALMDKAEQDVLGADVIVVKHACFFLRQNDDAASTIGKPLEHDSPILSLLM